MLRSLRTGVPRLRAWQLVAYTEGLTQRCAPAFSTEVASSVIDLTSDKEYTDALSAVRDKRQKAVIDFTAKWCGPCRMIAPLYNKFSQEFPDVKFYRVDIDSPDIADSVAEACVGTVPTFTFHKDGKRVASFSGADPSQLRERLEDLRE